MVSDLSDFPPLVSLEYFGTYFSWKVKLGMSLLYMLDAIMLSSTEYSVSIKSKRGCMRSSNVSCFMSDVCSAYSSIGNIHLTLEIIHAISVRQGNYRFRRETKKKKETGKKKKQYGIYWYSNTAERTRLIGQPGGTPSSIGAFLVLLISALLLPFFLAAIF